MVFPEKLFINSMDDLQGLKESGMVECKLAGGKDGAGKLPDDFWQTYSAFANTKGGIVLLGLNETKEGFKLAGIKNHEKVITELFNSLNDSHRISINLLTDKDVKVITLEGKSIIQVTVPPATRKQKPVYIGRNPFLGNTYRRLHDGDRKCDDETVKRMMAEQVEDSRDTKILEGYTIKDLDIESLKAYRQIFSVHRPDHPWNEVDDQTFLENLGCYRQNRIDPTEGLTIAGLLMFGKWPSIQEAVPYFFLDYRETTEDSSENRWIDRIVPDGSWSGNLFDFYRKVIRKLFDNIKTPFILKGDTRQDETPMHQALREALVNTLVHADYSERSSILVLKKPDGFFFRNPGCMRVSVEIALRGGESDSRNRTLHQLFLMIGLGERAGSGIAKIQQGWPTGGGSFSIDELFEPSEQTITELLFNDLSVEMSVEMSGKMPVKVSGKIIELIKNNQMITISELAVILELSERTIERYMKQLQEEGIIRRVGPKKGGLWEVIE